MRLSELGVICTEAAANLVERHGLPVPATVLLPLPEATKVVTLDGFPDDDASRVALLEQFTADRMEPENAPCYGFVAGAVAGEGPDTVDVVMAVYGARNHHPQVTAAPVVDGAITEFADPEDLMLDAMPFVVPLQRAADGAVAPDVMPTDPNSGRT